MPLILVVEDEKELNKLLQAYLTRAGYRALGAFSGDEGLRLYEQEKPDLVPLDLNPPAQRWAGTGSRDAQVPRCSDYHGDRPRG